MNDTGNLILWIVLVAFIVFVVVTFGIPFYEKETITLPPFILNIINQIKSVLSGS